MALKILESFGSRVRGAVDLEQSGACDVGVDLGRRHVRVAQHGLHGAQIGSAFEQVTRE